MDLRYRFGSPVSSVIDKKDISINFYELQIFVNVVILKPKACSNSNFKIKIEEWKEERKKKLINSR
jgi:hypothetical protein